MALSLEQTLKINRKLQQLRVVVELWEFDSNPDSSLPSDVDLSRTYYEDIQSIVNDIYKIYNNECN